MYLVFFILYTAWGKGLPKPFHTWLLFIDASQGSQDQRWTIQHQPTKGKCCESQVIHIHANRHPVKALQTCMHHVWGKVHVWGNQAASMTFRKPLFFGLPRRFPIWIGTDRCLQRWQVSQNQPLNPSVVFILPAIKSGQVFAFNTKTPDHVGDHWKIIIKFGGF